MTERGREGRGGSPEERATRLREVIEEFTDEQICGWALYPELEAIIAAAIREAEQAMKERCVYLVEHADTEGQYVTDEDGEEYWQESSTLTKGAIAAAIRALE